MVFLLEVFVSYQCTDYKMNIHAHCNKEQRTKNKEQNEINILSKIVLLTLQALSLLDDEADCGELDAVYKLEN